MMNTMQKIGAIVAALACAIALVLVFVPAIPNPGAPVVPADPPRVSTDNGDSSAAGEPTSSDEDAGEILAEVADEAVGSDESGGGGPGGEDNAGDSSGLTADGLPAYEQGVVLVTLSDSVSADEALQTLRDETGLGGLSVQMNEAGFAKVMFSSDIGIERAVALINGSSVVEAAQPNFYYYPMEGESADSAGAAAARAGLTAETEFGLTAQAAANVTDSNATKWVFSSIEAYDAWDAVVAMKNAGKLTPVTVAVIDTSFVYSHEDFQGTYFAKSGSGTGAAASGFVDPCDASSGAAVASTSLGGSNYHGQHVSGIVAAQANNGKGGAGVTYNMVRVMPVKVGDNTITTEKLVAAYDWILDKAEADNVRVVNLSLGAKRNSDDWSSDDRLLLAKIDQAYEEDIITVTAACNKNSTTGDPPFYCYPGDHDTCVTVIALQNTGNSASPSPGEVSRYASSNFNRPGQKTKDISAPGANLYNTFGARNDSYAYESGTSMATPVVSGVLALMFEVNYSMTAEQAVAMLYSSAYDIGSSGCDETYGYGEVNAKNAVETALTSAIISGSSALNRGASGTYTLSLPNGVAIGSNAVTWSQQGSDQPIQIAGSGASVTVTGVKAGTATLVAEVTVDGVKYVGSLDIKVSVPTVTGNASVAIGDKTAYTVSGITANSSDWVWTSSNTSVATIDSGGNLSAEAAGKTTVKAALKSDANVTASLEVTVTKINLSSTTNGLSVTYVRPTYNGSAQKPTVTVKKGSLVLTAGKDYTVEYSNNINAGTSGRFTIKATANGRCSGSKKYVLEILTASIQGASVQLHQTTYAYTGSTCRPQATVVVGGRTLVAGIDYTMSYSNAVSVGTATATITGKGNYEGTTSKMYQVTTSPAWDSKLAHHVQYRTHVQNDGWQKWVSDGATSGTSGRSLRLEGIKIALVDYPYSGSIRYRTHVQNIGWQGWQTNGAMSGTSGQSLRLEAIQIQLTGKMAEHYDVYYRVHAQNVGWMGWAKNGASAGTAGYSYRLEAIQIKLVPKGYAAPGSTKDAFRAPKVQYRTHVQNVGWQGYVNDGATSGTSGRSLRLEGINIKLGAASGIVGGIQYRTHVQNIGWQGWRSNGAMSGTSGKSLRLEAIQIRLTGAAASNYDVYYRVHCQNIGWMGWAKNGASAGTAGYSYRLEAIQVKLVPRGGSAPGSTRGAFRQR